MPAARPTDQEAAELLDEPKVIAVNISWTHDGRRHRLEAAVLAEHSGRLLRLIGNAGIRNRSFGLLYNNTPIRLWCYNYHRRTNPDGEVIQGPHKHRYDEDADVIWAYVPDDMRPGDVNREFRDFLNECNVRLQGTYGSLTIAQQFDLDIPR